MTFAEVERAIESKKRVYKLQAQDKAAQDYILADLIGRSIARVYGSTNSYPSITEAYPNLFDKEQIEEQQVITQDNLSALRFKQFATAFNSNFNKGGK